MCKDDVLKMLHARFEDEINDSNEYFRMSKSLDCSCQKDLAKGLYEMSKDEYTHAKFIHNVLSDNCFPIDPAVKDKWLELEARAKRVYTFY